MLHLGLQGMLVWSLLDIAVAVCWSWWQRATAWRDGPVLRLHTTRLDRRLETGVVAVLVSRPAMAERLRDALGARARLAFTSTWDELQHVVARVSPSTVFADPAADGAGDPVGHLAHLSRDQGVPVILYTTLTPATAEHLLRLGGCGISHVVFHRYDDGARRLEALCDSGPSEPPLRAA